MSAALRRFIRISPAFCGPPAIPTNGPPRRPRALRAKIVGVILNDERLRHLRDPIPENWLQIKGRVRDLAKQRSVLTLPEFIALCSDPGNGSEPITDQDVQRALLQLFHHLGTIIAHGLARNAAATRREVSLLDPNWLTGAIYRILEKARTVDQDGEFLRSDLDAWLDPDLYPADRHEFILDMMQEPEVGLCFRLPDQQQRYLVPEALPAIKPFLGVWPDDVLRFRYRYSYLPSGLIPRLIVESHRNVSPGMPRWRNGVVLVTRRCTVLVEANSGKQRIDLQIDGPVALRRSALNVVLNDLETVHARNPEAEPLAVVPLTDDLNSDVSYDYLLELERQSIQDFLSESTRRRYRVDEHLNGVRRDQDVVPVRHPVDPRSEAQSHLHTVILIHGIRTTALWQNEIRKTLESQSFKVQLTNYGRFDLLRFLCPGQFFRRRVLKDITQQVRDIVSRSGAPCSVIAHSFGTFIVSGILQSARDVRFHRIIFCGSVVRYRFPVAEYSHRFDGELINEVGTRDVWPVLAETVTTGYGSAGTYGFKRLDVRDRWHNGKTHSAFLTRDFCERYWVPLLRDGSLVEHNSEAKSPPWWLQIIAVVQPRYVIAAGIVLWLAVRVAPSSWWPMARAALTQLFPA